MITTAQLRDREELGLRLAAAGGTGPALADVRKKHVDAFVRLGEYLAGRGLEASDAFFVPGRIEVLGKHTDYAGGRSLLCAVSRGFRVVVAPADSPAVEFVDVDRGRSTAFRVDAHIEPATGTWAAYPQVVARRLAANFGIDRGGVVAFTSDLPIAAGISSSSALVVASFLALIEMNSDRDDTAFGSGRGLSRGSAASAAAGLHNSILKTHNFPDLPSLADYLGCVENGREYPGLPGTSGVGTKGGSEDHTAILCSKPGELSQYAFAPTLFEASAPMPAGHAFVIASSGIAAEKTGAALADYNYLGLLCDVAVEAWTRYTGVSVRHLGEILSRAPVSDLEAAVAAYARVGVRPERVVERVRQFHAETFETIPAAVEALHAGDIRSFGVLVERSQQGAETGLRNQIPETVHLVATANRLGAVAASAFGAGFGGSVWAMVDVDTADAFAGAWADDYRAAFPSVADEAQFFVEQPGPAAFGIGVRS